MEFNTEKGYERAKSTEDWWPPHLLTWKSATIYSVFRLDEEYNEMWTIVHKVSEILSRYETCPFQGISMLFFVLPKISNLDKIAQILTTNFKYFCYATDTFIVLELNTENEPEGCSGD